MDYFSISAVWYSSHMWQLSPWNVTGAKGAEFLFSFDFNHFKWLQWLATTELWSTAWNLHRATVCLLSALGAGLAINGENLACSTVCHKMCFCILISINLRNLWILICIKLWNKKMLWYLSTTSSFLLFAFINVFTCT